MKRVWQIAFWLLVAYVAGSCALQTVTVVTAHIRRSREWHREAAPFQALGAEVRATGGGDMGFSAGRAGIASIYFREGVRDRDLAALAARMERFPNLHSLVLQGPEVTDAGLAHLKRLKQLRQLALHDTRVTEGGKLSLQRELPKLQIW